MSECRICHTLTIVEPICGVCELEENRNRITHLEAQLAEKDRELEARQLVNEQMAQDVLKATETLRYILGIVERGSGVKIGEQTIERYVLDYVKHLEAYESEVD